MTDENVTRIPAATLVAAFEQCLTATATDRDSRPSLTGISLRVTSGAATFTGCNSFAAVRISCESAGEMDAIIAAHKYEDPAGSFKHLLTVLKKAVGDVSITASATEIMFASSLGTVAVPNMGAHYSYPTMEGLIPERKQEPTTETAHWTAVNPILMAPILNAAGKHGRKVGRYSRSIVRMQSDGPRGCIRLDWKGDGWEAVAAVMPMETDHS